ncbi:putative GPI-anchored protein 17 [Candida tropicalis]
MKFSTIFTTTFSIFSIVNAQQQQGISPVSDPLSLEIAGRDLDKLYQFQERDLLDVVEGLVSNINVTSILDSIDFESIAGWVDRILNTNDNVQYLDDLLNFVADTDIVPFLISWIISNNSTRTIAGEVAIDLLGVAGKFDLTPVFVALKDSGLAYTLIADLIKNPHTFPFVKQVVIDLLSGSGSGSVATTTSAIFATTGTTALTFATTGTSSANGLGLGLFGSGSSASISLSAGSINTNIQFTDGGVATMPGPVVQSSTSIGSINTASLANLFSQAAAENTDPDTIVGDTETVATTVATTATTAATLGSGAITSVNAQATEVSGDNFLGVTGPAFQSVPASQFGAGPTSINLSALAQITGALNGKRENMEEERDDPVARALNQMRKKREVKDPVAMILEEIRKREIEDHEVEQAMRKIKRDNIQNLLTTIFSSVARSDILNETIDYLVTDQRFEDSVVLILRGVFSNIGSTLTGVLSFDWASLAPLVRALFNSGLITDTISRAFNDPDLGPALWSDITSLFKRDLMLRDEILSAINGTDITSLPISEFITATVSSDTTTTVLDGAEGILSSLEVSEFINTLSISAADNSTTPEVSVVQSAAGFALGTSLYTSFFAMLTIITMML